MFVFPHSNAILPERGLKVDKSTLTAMITLIIVHFLFIEKSICAASSIEVDNFHRNSFCDMKPNCDGDSELYERLMREDDGIMERGNSVYNYPVTRKKRSFAPYRTGKTVASQVSQTLDNLLLHSDYDKRIRPQVFYGSFNIIIQKT